MAASVRIPRKFTEVEYLLIERGAEFKSEYVDGCIYAMAGGSPTHGLIAGNVIAELRGALRDKGCRVYTSDVRIHVEDESLYVYPDASVVCGEDKYYDHFNDTVVNPIIIVEVLSDSTEDYDRSLKFTRYKTIASLEYFMLVSQKSPTVEVYARKARAQWLVTTYSSMVDIISLDMEG